jgi:hypothetical protein
MFFWEIRLLFSTFLLFYLWYGMGLFDYFLHQILVHELQKVVKLPVKVDAVTCFVSGIAIIKGIQISSPNINEDSRWELTHIVTIDLVQVKFPFFVSLFFFCFSNGELVIVDSVSVHGVRFYVEGYRSLVKSAHGFDEELVIYNVALIGKSSFSRTKKQRNSLKAQKKANSSSSTTSFENSKRKSKERRSNEIPSFSSSDGTADTATDLSRSLMIEEDAEEEGKEKGEDDEEVAEATVNDLSSKSNDNLSEEDNAVIDFNMKSFKLDENYFLMSDSDDGNGGYDETSLRLPVSSVLSLSQREMQKQGGYSKPSKSLSDLFPSADVDGDVESVPAVSIKEGLNSEIILSDSFGYISRSSLEEKAAFSSSQQVVPDDVVTHHLSKDICEQHPLSSSSTSSFSVSHATVSTSVSSSTPLPLHLLSSRPTSKRFSFSSLMTSFSDKVHQMKIKAKEINAKVNESGGIYNATKMKIVDVYEKTKQSIDESVQDRINRFHIYLSGHEPYVSPEMTRIIARDLVLDYVEIHLLRALPIQLRHLEMKPLIVEKLEFHELGYDNLRFIPFHFPTVSSSSSLSLPSSATTSSVSSLDLLNSSALHLERSHDVSTFHRLSLPSDRGEKAVKRQSSSRSRSTDNLTAILSRAESFSQASAESKAIAAEVLFEASTSFEIRSEEHVHSLESNSSSGSGKKQRKSFNAGTSIETETNLHRTHHHPSSSSSSSTSSFSSNIVTIRRFSNHKGKGGGVQIIEEDHSNQMIDLFSIDLWKSGLDVMIFKYQLERKILFALYKSNAGNSVFLYVFMWFLFFLCCFPPFSR